MKAGIHPDYRTVLFHDTAADVFFLIGSTADSDRTHQHSDGNTYPYIPLDVSSASHPDLHRPAAQDSGRRPDCRVQQALCGVWVESEKSRGVSMTISACLGRRLPNRQHHAKLRAFAQLTAHGNIPTVFFHDAVGEGQPQPCPFAHRFGGEERVEDFLQGFGRNAAAVIGHFHHTLPLPRRAMVMVPRSGPMACAALTTRFMTT